MKAPNGTARQLFPVFGLFLVLCLAACSEVAPTGPDVNDLCGKWLGTFVSPFDGRTVENSLTLTVRSGGVASATGYIWYDSQNVTFTEALFLELEVGPDGAITGEGRWLFQAVGYGAMLAYGTVTGSLESATGEGSGTFTASQDLSIAWTVEKEGGR